MIETPTKEQEKRKEEKDNIFIDILYNLVVQTPVLVISWIVSKLDWD